MIAPALYKEPRRARQCHYCGRKGSRQFVSIDGGLGWLCKRPRACNRRRRAFLAPLLKGAK